MLVVEMEVDSRWLCRYRISTILDSAPWTCRWHSIRLVLLPHFLVAMNDRSLFAVFLPGFLIPVHHMHIETTALYRGSLLRSRVTSIISCAFMMVFCILLTHTCLYYQARYCDYPLEQYLSLLVGQREHFWLALHRVTPPYLLCPELLTLLA